MALKQIIFKKFALIIFSVFLLNAVANVFYWYQSFFWFDMMMHFFGGLSMGLFFIWTFYRLYEIFLREKRFWRIVLINTTMVLLIAVLWEVMEFSVQNIFDIGQVLATPADSLSDIIFGILGNFSALGYYFLKIKYVRS